MAPYDNPTGGRGIGTVTTLILILLLVLLALFLLPRLLGTDTAGTTTGDAPAGALDDRAFGPGTTGTNGDGTTGTNGQGTGLDALLTGTTTLTSTTTVR